MPRGFIWFTIAAMLQDLDNLAARIGQLVQRTRQLHAERDALRARLNQAEQETRVLRERCLESDSRSQALQARLDDQDNEAGDRLAQAQRAEVELRAELEKHIEQRQAMDAQIAARESEWQSRLTARDTDLQRLRVAAVAARERIDAVLARLPGAPVGEQH
jgi:chromosome segregation ATPase